ncbi:hypothetical protein CEXT_76131 [Caerostris extrusa]|uniref:Uncharacterized protein n=1 Tax=Caerostris extrusa TaxID=172846 RepID=A0AAV4Y8M8_CAEEX|nr:hypothetical protein CEXT_76131 [Caerostris extrusa]
MTQHHLPPGGPSISNKQMPPLHGSRWSSDIAAVGRSLRLTTPMLMNCRSYITQLSGAFAGPFHPRECGFVEGWLDYFCFIKCIDFSLYVE